ncbi:MAG: glycosyltransferase family 4 protein [Myxococcales bacterium]
MQQGEEYRPFLATLVPWRPWRISRGGFRRPRAPAPSVCRLLHVTTVPSTLTFLTGQAAFLRPRGFEVLAVSSPGDELERFGAAEGVTCFAVPMARRISPFEDLVALARLFKLFRRLKPDIVDAHTPKAGLLGILAAWLAGVPVRVYHLHGLRFLTVHGLRRHLLVAAERVAGGLATQVLCVSRSYAELTSRYRLAPDRKVGVLLAGSINGVDTRAFRPPGSREERRAARRALGVPEDARVVGFVGRLARDKGIVELAEAWQRLREELPDAHLVLVGPYEEGDPVPQPVLTQLLSDPRVTMAGLRADAARCYQAFDVLALPTYREGLGMASLEAAATAVPVVSTRVPGCTDAIVDGVTGTLVPPRDERELARALRAYLEDPALRRRHGAAARRRVVQEFGQQRIWEALHHEYLRLRARSATVAGPAAPDSPELTRSTS